MRFIAGGEIEGKEASRSCCGIVIVDLGRRSLVVDLSFEESEALFPPFLRAI